MKVASVSCLHLHTTLLQYPTQFYTPSKYNPKTSSSELRRRRLRTTKSEIEIRVCVNRSCRKQGSRETLETLSGISPPDITVKSCGCLGRCGSGPNLVVLPESVLVSHCGTATRTAQVLASFLGGKEGDPEKNLKALALRKRAEEELEKQNLSEAEILLSQRLEMMGQHGSGGNRKDPAWKHGIEVEGPRSGKAYVYIKCNYCRRVIKGGVKRMKDHLAGTRRNVSPCIQVPEYAKKRDERIFIKG